MRNSWIWKMRPYYRRVAGLLVLGMTSGVIMNTSVVLPAVYLGRTLDATLAYEAGTATAREVLLLALAYMGFSTLYFVTRIGKRWWLRTATRRTVYAVQSDALRGVLAWPLERLQGRGVGELMARILSDSQVLGSGFNECTTELVDTWLFSISLLVGMIAYDPGLAFWSMVPVPIALYLSYRANEWVRQRASAVREATADLTSSLQENLRGVRVLRLYGRTESAIQRVADLAQRLQRTTLNQVRLEFTLQPVYSIVITSGMMLIVWLGGRRAIDGSLSVGALVAFITLYLRFVGRGHRLPSWFNRVQRAQVAWDRLEPMLAPPPPLEGEPKNASWRPAHIPGLEASLPESGTATTGPLALELRDAVFQYPGAERAALSHVDLEVPAGSLIAITGPIGSGKSALLRAALGLYPLTSGEILIGGKPVADLDEATRAERMAYVPQDPELFTGTVAGNLLPDADIAVTQEPWLQDVISAASLDRDLDEMPDGLSTRVGEGGLRVSGGQRQRIALARALAVGGTDAPGVILLDDPFASVDVETEGKIIAALYRTYGPGAPPDRKATIVLCSHRLAAFPQADRVAVLENGRLIAHGTHEELLAQEGLYARIYRAQHTLASSGVNLDGQGDLGEEVI